MEPAPPSFWVRAGRDRTGCLVRHGWGFGADRRILVIASLHDCRAMHALHALHALHAMRCNATRSGWVQSCNDAMRSAVTAGNRFTSVYNSRFRKAPSGCFPNRWHRGIGEQSGTSLENQKNKGVRLGFSGQVVGLRLHYAADSTRERPFEKHNLTPLFFEPPTRPCGPGGYQSRRPNKCLRREISMTTAVLLGELVALPGQVRVRLGRNRRESNRHAHLTS
jgi:hypothetical protein